MDDTGLIARIFGAKHMTPELPFNLWALFTHTIIYLQRKIFANRKGRGAYAYMPSALSFDATIDLIAERIRKGEPFMAGKIGTGDGEALARYIDIHAAESPFVKALKIFAGKRGPFWWDNSIRAGICNCAGVFPVQDAAIEKFCRIFMETCREIDAFASFNPGEYRLHQMLCPNAKAEELYALVPYNSPRTWYGALEGKKLLVVHLYEKTIRAQYEKNVEFHKGQGPFPRVKELITYRPVNSIGGTNADFPDWAAALDHMVDDISKIDFDVAMLGCGVYGVPLSVHIKRMGKIAIYTGGATQVAFGIKGKRWDTCGIYNEHWTRAFPEDIPDNMKTIEEGCFL